MSSYFFGGFSAYFIEPSGRRLNQSGCCFSHGMIRRALHGEVERDLDARAACRRRRKRAEVLERAELGMDRVVAAFLGADRVGAAGIAGSGLQRIVAPLAVDVVPIGWIGVKYSTSKPIAAMSGSRAMQSRKVPCWPGTCSGCAAPSRTRRHCARARGRPSAAAARSGSGPAAPGSPPSRRQLGSEQGRDVAALQIVLALPLDSRQRVGPPCCALVSMPAPSSASSVDVLAGLAASARRRAARWRIRRSRLRSHRRSRPIRSGVKVAVQRSLPACRIGDALPVAVLLAAPDQRRGDHLVAVAIDVGPHLDRLADDPLDGKSAADR